MRIFAAVLGLTLMACGSYEEVDYTVECKTVTCSNADSKSESMTYGVQAMACVWECHDYMGESDQAVVITFAKTGSCWEQTSVTTAPGCED